MSAVTFASATDAAAATPPASLTLTDSIDTEGATGIYEVELEAGHTYLFSLRGTGDTPLKDPVVGITLPGSEDTLALDDDGGIGSNALLTFVPTVSGTYAINTGANQGTGTYTLDVREMAADSVGDTIATAGELAANTTEFGFLETQDDVDVYHVSITAGQVYTFLLSGGTDASSGTPLPGTELDTVLQIFDSNHKLVGTFDDLAGDDLSSGLSFQAGFSGDYYIAVRANNPHQGAGYVLSMTEETLDGKSPLDTINWGPDAKLASNNVTVYFAPDGTTIGGYTSQGWSPYEISRAMAALGEWASVADLHFSITDDPDSATFKLVSSDQLGDGLLGRFNPPGEADAGVGVFNPTGAGWDGVGGLERGGYGYVTLVHEFGHGLGLSHPHDDGGNSQVMPGVLGSTGTLGVYNLNQTVYTIMSYNDGWVLHPDAALGLPGAEGPTSYGQPTGPGALDIAVIQDKYGAVDQATGDTVYTLPTENTLGTLYQTIWDTGGHDAIRYDGAADARIDLTAATLDYSATGGGVISYSRGVFGGFTIAHGVVIEDAIGGSGNDTLVGNDAANGLVGGAGNDILDGRAGDDLMVGGLGDDVFVVDSSGDRVREAAGEGTDIVNASASFNMSGQFIEQLVLLGAAAAGQGNSLDNVIVGNGDANLLSGMAGDDRLDGGAGADVMKGGLGDDTYVVDNALDTIIEYAGQGIDTVESTVSYHLPGMDVEILKLRGDADINGTGNSLDNILYGNGANNVLNGAAGADAMYGGLGNDTYIVDNAGDRAYEKDGAGYDVVESSVSYSLAGQYIEELRLTGDAVSGTGNGLDNLLWGNRADNILSGGAGADQLHGWSGADTLTGGAGADGFWFETTLRAGNVDTITDFVSGEDMIHLDQSIFTALAEGALSSAAFYVGTAAHDADDRIVYDQATGKIWYDADGSGSGSAVLFAQVTANISLTNGDFMVHV